MSPNMTDALRGLSAIAEFLVHAMSLILQFATAHIFSI